MTKTRSRPIYRQYTTPGMQAGLDRLPYTPPPAIRKGPMPQCKLPGAKGTTLIGKQPYWGPSSCYVSRRVRRGRRAHNYTHGG